MSEMNNHIFIYGTLLDSKNEFGSFFKDNCCFISPAKFKGKMYDAREYPCVVPSGDDKDVVHGSVFLMPRPERILKVLDDYEGFGDEQEQPNLFVRSLMKVKTSDNKPVACWIYLYNLPVEGLRQIVSGKYQGR